MQLRKIVSLLCLALPFAQIFCGVPALPGYAGNGPASTSSLAKNKTSNVSKVPSKLPDLSGHLVIEYTLTPYPAKHKFDIRTEQKGLDISGSGTDEYGAFKVSGSVTLPNKIELKKSYPNAAVEQQTPIIFVGQFSLPDNPGFVSGSWSHTYLAGGLSNPKKRSDGRFPHAELLVKPRTDIGTWEGQFLGR